MGCICHTFGGVQGPKIGKTSRDFTECTFILIWQSHPISSHPIFSRIELFQREQRDNEICTSDGQIDVYRDPIPYTTASTWRSCSNTVLFTAGKTCQKDTRYETTLILTKVKWLHRSWNKALFPRWWGFHSGFHRAFLSQLSSFSERIAYQPHGADWSLH